MTAHATASWPSSRATVRVEDEFQSVSPTERCQSPTATHTCGAPSAASEALRESEADSVAGKNPCAVRSRVS